MNKIEGSVLRLNNQFKISIILSISLFMCGLLYGQESKKNIIVKEKGFTNITELVYSKGLEDTYIDDVLIAKKYNSYGFKTINGYRFNKLISIGAGIGIEKNEYATLLPISMDLRISLLKGKIRPILNGSIGYSYQIDDFDNNRLFINPTIGIKIHLPKKMAYILSIGYKWYQQKTTYYSYIPNNSNYSGYTYYEGYMTENQKNGTEISYLPFLSFSTGIEF